MIRIPNVLRDLLDLDGGAYIAGGAIVREMRGEEPNDWDVWCSDVDELADHLRGIGFHAVESRDSESTEGRTLWADGTTTIDLIEHNFGPPEDVWSRFDFRCCMIATDGHSLRFAGGAMDDILSGHLVPMRRTTGKRIEKYLARGFVLAAPRSAVVLGAGSTVAQRLGSDPVRVGE